MSAHQRWPWHARVIELHRGGAPHQLPGAASGGVLPPQPHAAAKAVGSAVLHHLNGGPRRARHVGERRGQGMQACVAQVPWPSCICPEQGPKRVLPCAGTTRLSAIIVAAGRREARGAPEALHVGRDHHAGPLGGTMGGCPSGPPMWVRVPRVRIAILAHGSTTCMVPARKFSAQQWPS